MLWFARIADTRNAVLINTKYDLYICSVAQEAFTHMRLYVERLEALLVRFIILARDTFFRQIIINQHGRIAALALLSRLKIHLWKSTILYFKRELARRVQLLSGNTRLTRSRRVSYCQGTPD